MTCNLGLRRRDAPRAGILAQPRKGGAGAASPRAGKAQIAKAYVYVKNGEAFLFGAHITPLSSASTHVETDPTRTRKLLLTRRQLHHLIGEADRASRFRR